MGQENISKDSSDSAKNSKDAFFDPKPKPKMIRVLTVLAYVLSVSMAAIFLSIYYIFMWHGEPHLGALKNHDYNGSEKISSGLNLSHPPVIALLAGKIMEDITDEDNITYSTDFTQEETTTNEYTASLDPDMQQQITALESDDESLSLPTRSEINTTTTTIRWQDDYNDSMEDFKKSLLIKKLLDKDRYEDNY